MPTFTITLSDPAVTRLQPLVARYNADQGTTLSVQDWIELHLKEIAIGEELSRAAEDLQRQSEQAAQAAIIAERRRLLDSLALSPEPP